MTTLPATLTDAIEAQAMAFARGWIARAREGNFIGLGCAPLHPEAGRLFLRRLIKVAALGNPFAMSELADVASAGWDDADIALRELIAGYLNQNERLPAVLAAYAIKLANPHPWARGQKRATNIMQDVVIFTLAMELVERFDLRPTRSQTGRKLQPSACSVVSAAMTEARMHRGGEEAAQKVWKRYAPIVLPGIMTKTFISQ